MSSSKEQDDENNPLPGGQRLIAMEPNEENEEKYCSNAVIREVLDEIPIAMEQHEDTNEKKYCSNALIGEVLNEIPIAMEQHEDTNEEKYCSNPVITEVLNEIYIKSSNTELHAQKCSIRTYDSADESASEYEPSNSPRQTDFPKCDKCERTPSVQRLSRVTVQMQKQGVQEEIGNLQRPARLRKTMTLTAEHEYDEDMPEPENPSALRLDHLLLDDAAYKGAQHKRELSPSKNRHLPTKDYFNIHHKSLYTQAESPEPSVSEEVLECTHDDIEHQPDKIEAERYEMNHNLFILDSLPSHISQFKSSCEEQESVPSKSASECLIGTPRSNKQRLIIPLSSDSDHSPEGTVNYDPATLVELKLPCVPTEEIPEFYKLKTEYIPKRSLPTAYHQSDYNSAHFQEAETAFPFTACTSKWGRTGDDGPSTSKKPTPLPHMKPEVFRMDSPCSSSKNDDRKKREAAVSAMKTYAILMSPTCEPDFFSVAPGQRIERESFGVTKEDKYRWPNYLAEYRLMKMRQPEVLADIPFVKKFLHKCEAALARNEFVPTPSDPNKWLRLLAKHNQDHVPPPRSSLASRITKFLKEKKYTNITIQVGAEYFACAIEVLQVYSEFFKENKDLEHLSLPEDYVGPEAFARVYQWMMGDATLLERETIVTVLKAARFLRIPALESQCMNVFGNTQAFNEDTAFAAYLEACSHDLVDLQRLMLPRVSLFFLRLVASLEYVELTIDQVCDLLSSNTIAVNTEIEVFMSANRWLRYRWAERKKFAANIMGCVRFAMIPSVFLLTLVATEDDRSTKWVQEDSEVSKLISEGISLNLNNLHFYKKEQLKKYGHKIANVKRQWIKDPCCKYHRPYGAYLEEYLPFKTFVQYLDCIREKEFPYWKTLEVM